MHGQPVQTVVWSSTAGNAFALLRTARELAAIHATGNHLAAAVSMDMFSRPSHEVGSAPATVRHKALLKGYGRANRINESR